MTMTPYVFLLGRTPGNQGREGHNFCLKKKEKGKMIWAAYLTENPKGLRSMQIMQNISHYNSLYEDGTNKIHFMHLETKSTGFIFAPFDGLLLSTRVWGKLTFQIACFLVCQF